MVMATADTEQQRSDLQFGPSVTWYDLSAPAWAVPDIEALGSKAAVPRAQDQVGPEEGLRAMYARLAREYLTEPAVPDAGGGVPGDRYEL